MKNIDPKYFNSSIFRWFNMLQEGIVLLDENINIVFVNDAYLNLTGLKEENLIGQYMPKIRPGAVSPEVYRSKIAKYNCYRNVNGTVTYADVIPYVDKGEVVGGLVVLRDMHQINDLFKVINENENKIQLLNERLGALFRTRYERDGIVGMDADYWRIAKTAATTNSSVLLIGESGTGKEVVAQMIHNLSARSDKNFVDVNCAAIPEQLMESELFGYVSGAYTGASKQGRMGLFELANHGTLFLDEITEMPLALQSKLLRALQEKTIRRLGDNRNIPLDVRVIAATNQCIGDALAEHRFRSDLYYRLSVFEIEIPPLRQRKDNITEYVNLFIAEQKQKKNIAFRIVPEVLGYLLKYPRPGNFRQLKNALEYMCEVAVDGVITVDSLPRYVLAQEETLTQTEGAAAISPWNGLTLSQVVMEAERNALEGALQKFGTDVRGKQKAAQSLGISVATLYNKLKRYGM